MRGTGKKSLDFRQGDADDRCACTRHADKIGVEMRKMMRTIAAAVALSMLVAVPAMADEPEVFVPDGARSAVATGEAEPVTSEPLSGAPEREEGVTWDDENGVCWEADGTEGIPVLDGGCMTPADYDAVYNIEVLAETPSIQNPDVSIAELYELDTSDPTPASDKPIGEGLVEPGTERTFKERVADAHMAALAQGHWN